MTYSNANFTPSLKGYSNVKPFRFWCQKVLPLVYDDSLSYYELLCKVVDYLNNVISDLSATEDNVGDLLTAYNQLQNYVNNYFTNLDVQEEINTKLDAMFEDGTIPTMIEEYVHPFIETLNKNYAELDTQINATMTTQNENIATLTTRVNNLVINNTTNLTGYNVVTVESTTAQGGKTVTENIPTSAEILQVCYSGYNDTNDTIKSDNISYESTPNVPSSTQQQVVVTITDATDTRFNVFITYAVSQDIEIAELTDIRLGYDGTVYTSAGDAVRGQVGDLKNAVDELNGGSINLLNPADFQQGKYLVASGGLSDNADLTASGYFPVSGNTTYFLYRSNTYPVRVCFYTADSEGGYISNSLTDISSGTSTFTTPATASYARISTNKNMILDMGIYASDIRYYIPYQLRLADGISIENQIDNTLTDDKKAAPASIVGELKNAVILPEKCIKFGDAGMVVNERLDLTNGAVVTGSNGQTRTDYIPVKVGDYVQTCAIRNICLYNDQFEYLGYINLWSSNDTVVPPVSWSGNYNSNITQITAINGINPSYIRCWGRYDSYPPAVSMLSGEPYKVLNLGDSIFGNNEKPWDLGTYIQNITGMKDANCGYGGTTARVIPSGNMSPLGLPSIVDCIVSEDFSPLKTPAYWASLQEYRYSVPTLLFGMVDFSEIEVITIAYGTNDWNSDTPLDNAENRLDISTYKGGLRYAIENLQTKYPAITLVMLSPIYRYWSNSSDYSTIDTDSDTRTNSLGLKLIDYVTAMEEVANEYHLPYFNNYDNIGLNRYTATTWLRDGTHLNRDIGVDKMGHIVARELNQIY